MSLFGPKPLTRKNLEKILDKCGERIFTKDLELLYNDLCDKGPAGLDGWNIWPGAKRQILERLEIPNPRRRELVLRRDWDDEDEDEEHERDDSEVSETTKKVAATAVVGVAAAAAGFWHGYNAPSRKKWSLLD